MHAIVYYMYYNVRTEPYKNITHWIVRLFNDSSVTFILGHYRVYVLALVNFCSICVEYCIYRYAVCTSVITSHISGISF